MIFNKKQFLAVVLLAWIPCGLTQAEDPANSLTVGEGFVNPLGFHDVTPTFSWKLPDGTRAQTAYRIEVNNESVIWDSGWVESDQSVFVPYKGEPLQSRQRLNWRVNVKDEDGKEAGWSESATFELGLMSKDDWSGKWIRPADEGSSEIEHVTRFRRQFEAADSIKTARLFVAARGVFEVSLNGQKVAEDHFANGFTSYKNRLDSLTYDVTDLLQEGENSFDAMLGFGWFAGRFGFKGERHYFGPYPELLLQLEIEYNDGSKKTIVSDENWEATFDGPIVSSSIYDGEHFDARKESTNWKPPTDIFPSR